MLSLPSVEFAIIVSLVVLGAAVAADIIGSTRSLSGKLGRLFSFAIGWPGAKLWGASPFRAWGRGRLHRFFETESLVPCEGH